MKWSTGFPRKERASPATFSPDGTDEEFIAFVEREYFLPDELVEARRMLETGKPHAEAIAYLVGCAHHDLRDSGEEKPPRLFITIPGDMVHAHHPLRRWPEKAVLSCSIMELALRVFPPPIASTSPSPNPESSRPDRYHVRSLFDEEPEPASIENEKPKMRPSRGKRFKFVAQPVRMGTLKYWRQCPGWIVKDGPLGYAIESRTDFHSIHLVHLRSNRAMATVYVTSLDETTHTRIRAWVIEVLALADWTQGIAALLKEKKARDWARQIEDLWRKHKMQRLQLSLF